MLCNGFEGWQMENIPTHLINFNVIKNTMKITESVYNTYLCCSIYVELKSIFFLIKILSWSMINNTIHIKELQ